MKKKIISGILSIIGILLVGLSILYFLNFFEPQKAGILIESDPIATIFIDGQEMGKTPYEAEFKPKEIMIKIKPESLEGQIFDDYETKVEIWVDTSSGLSSVDYSRDSDYCFRRSFVSRVVGQCQKNLVSVSTFDSSLKQMGALSSLCVSHGISDQDRLISWIKNSKIKYYYIAGTKDFLVTQNSAHVQDAKEPVVELKETEDEYVSITSVDAYKEPVSVLEEEHLSIMCSEKLAENIRNYLHEIAETFTKKNLNEHLKM